MITKLFMLLLMVMIAGAVVSIVVFVVDVWRWHDKEEKVIITPSAQESESLGDEKEVEVNGSNDGEYNSSAVSFPWSEP